MMYEPTELREIYSIREQIYEETKNMTPEERAKYTNDQARILIKQYDLKIEPGHIREGALGEYF